MSLIYTTETTTAAVADDLKSEISGKTVLITGVTIGGLGFEAAYNIAKYAKELIITGTNLEKLQKSEDKIHDDFKDVKVHKIVLDLSSLKAAHAAAAEINALGLPIHVVIANAIGPVRNQYSVTTDGHESQFAISHLAHFVLVNSILPRVFAARSDSYTPRLVIVSSRAHLFTGVHLDDTTFGNGKEYNAIAGYAQSKSANILYSKQLAEKLASKGVSAFSLHPGAIKTNGFESLGTEERKLMGVLKPDGTVNEALVLKRLDQGAVAYLVAAFDPRIADKSGSYISADGQIHDEELAPHVTDPALAKQLWTLSEKLVGQTYDI